MTAKKHMKNSSKKTTAYSTIGERNLQNILTPDEIVAAGFCWEHFPIFQYNGVTRYVKRIRLSDFYSVGKPNMTNFSIYQRSSILSMHRMGITHVHSVKFSLSPTTDGHGKKRNFYYVFVYGAMLCDDCYNARELGV
jgi:hypothetical protein